MYEPYPPSMIAIVRLRYLGRGRAIGPTVKKRSFLLAHFESFDGEGVLVERGNEL